MLDENYVPLINKPTRVTHTTGTLIDNVYVRSNSLKKNYSYVIIDGMSDHYPCMVSYLLSGHTKTAQLNTMVEKRKLTEDAMLQIQQHLLFFDWGALTDLDVDESYELLTNTITHAMDMHAPKKIVKIRVDEKFREPWLTVKLKKTKFKMQKIV